MNSSRKQRNRLKCERYRLKKIGDIKEPFHVKMGVIKDRDSKALTDTEEIKKRWQKYTEVLYKKKRA